MFKLPTTFPASITIEGYTYGVPKEGQFSLIINPIIADISGHPEFAMEELLIQLSIFENWKSDHIKPDVDWIINHYEDESGCEVVPFEYTLSLPEENWETWDVIKVK